MEGISYCQKAVQCPPPKCIYATKIPLSYKLWISSVIWEGSLCVDGKTKKVEIYAPVYPFFINTINASKSPTIPKSWTQYPSTPLSIRHPPSFPPLSLRRNTEDSSNKNSSAQQLRPKAETINRIASLENWKIRSPLHLRMILNSKWADRLINWLNDNHVKVYIW